jgi:hypothetical protein
MLRRCWRGPRGKLIRHCNLAIGGGAAAAGKRRMYCNAGSGILVPQLQPNPAAVEYQLWEKQSGLSQGRRRSRSGAVAEGGDALRHLQVLSVVAVVAGAVAPAVAVADEAAAAACSLGVVVVPVAAAAAAAIGRRQRKTRSS